MSNDKFTVIYDPDCEIINDPIVVPDDKVYKTARLYWQQYQLGIKEIVVGSELLINAFRVLIKRGQIDYTKIRFKYHEDIILPNKNGMFEYYPNGFIDNTMRMMTELLGK